jgi:hypothetical protein
LKINLEQYILNLKIIKPTIIEKVKHLVEVLLSEVKWSKEGAPREENVVNREEGISTPPLISRKNN